MERPAPIVDDRSRPFWTGGAEGELRIARCRGCGRWQHPPTPICPACHGRAIAPEAVSGRGTVWSFTLNRYAWAPGMEPPYVVAEVELEEGIRLLSTVVGVDPDQVRIGLPVHVAFERAGDAWVPVFTP